MCLRLRNPSNGFVKLTNKLNTGSQANYECRSGYIIEGDRIRVCQPNGEWSGRHPICKCKY